MTDHVRWLPRDRLALVDKSAGALLQQALAQLFAPGALAVQSFVSRAESGCAAVVHVVPTTGQARDIFDGGLAVLAVTEVTAPEAPDAALIRALFDLSAAEARVARGLASGQSIAQMAAAAGISRETVRTQMRSVLAKTGTTRQAEVVALLSGLPRFATRK